MIPKAFVQTLLSRVDIVDVIQGYIPLKKGGANYMARCPFHDEKSASFSVSPSKQFYYCFGCGATGSAIGFLMDYAGMNFPEAIESLAESHGMTVPQDTTRPEKKAPEGEALEDFLKRAWAFYRQALKDHAPAVEYLKRRGLTGQIAAKYGLGYAPAGWQSLSSVFERYEHPGLVESGLVIATEEGKRYDRFRDRILFPILNARGTVIGFGGRIIDQGEPKYLNSPETPLFEKGRELYGLFQARGAIRDHGTVIVVEGYMDVVALAQHGIEYAVATLGTATTPHHIERLLKLGDKVVFAFDGDKAGRRAARRAFEVALEKLQDGKDVSFLFLPDEHDPDSFIRAHGQEVFEAKLKASTPLSSFLVDELAREHPEHSVEARAARAHQGAAWIASVKAPALQKTLSQFVAQAVGLPRSDIDALVAGAKPARVRETPEAPQANALPDKADYEVFRKQAWEDAKRQHPNRRPNPRPVGYVGGREAPTTLEETLVAALMLAPALVHVLHPDPADRELGLPALNAVADFIRDSQTLPHLAGFLEAFRGDEGVQRVVARAIRRVVPALQDTPPQEIQAVLEEGFKKVESERRQQELEALIQREAAGQASEDDRIRLKELLAARARP